MTERQILSRFLKQYKQHAEGFAHKEGDVYGGQKKPYDFYIVFDGVHIAVEAKKDDYALEEHQKTALYEVADAGGVSYVLRFRTGYYAYFYSYVLSEAPLPAVVVPFTRGSYDPNALESLARRLTGVL